MLERLGSVTAAFAVLVMAFRARGRTVAVFEFVGKGRDAAVFHRAAARILRTVQVR